MRAGNGRPESPDGRTSGAIPLAARNEPPAATREVILRAALEYAARGWPVFPAAGKRPLAAHGCKDASVDSDRITSWWDRWPAANVAIATGSPSGLLVIDVDDEFGADSLHELEREHGALPTTSSVKTGAGGQHLYFALIRGARNSAGLLGPGLDVRAAGGYVVAPPSVHPVTGAIYEWDVDPAEVGTCCVPGWLERLLGKRAPGRRRPVSEWRELACEGVSEGARNSATARLAGHLLAHGVDAQVVLQLLLAWNQRRCKPPLPDTEVARVVISIYGRETAK
jgi:hypothetical protein